MKDKYSQIVDKYTPREDVISNCLVSFVTGGIMGIIGQWLIDF